MPEKPGATVLLGVTGLVQGEAQGAALGVALDETAGLPGGASALLDRREAGMCGLGQIHIC